MLLSACAGSAVKGVELFKSVPWWNVKGQEVVARYRV